MTSTSGDSPSAAVYGSCRAVKSARSCRSAPKLVEYARDLVAKWPPKPSMCAHLRSRSGAELRDAA